MKAQVVGMEKVDYTSKKTNKDVKGVKLHCLIEGNTNTDGAAVETFFISLNEKNVDVSQALKKINLNNYINVSYNRFGFVDDIILLES